MMEINKIELTIKKKEDIVLLMQGLNWIRQNSIKELALYLGIMDKVKEEDKKYFDIIEEKAEVHDRIMTLIAQLDIILETKEEK